MRIRRTTFLLGAALAASVLSTAASGCGGGGDASAETKPVPVFNPDPANPNSGITLENESANMGRLKGKESRRGAEY